MNAQKKTLAVVLGGAFVASVAMSPVVHADQNPFAMKTLDKGYQVADAKDGKCGTGKCGANKKKETEGKCSADKKSADGKCSADKKSAEGNCSADKKGAEGNCSANKK